MVLGLLHGTALTLAVIIARARFQQLYLESEHDLLGIMGVPAAVAMLLVPLIAWRDGGRTLLALLAGSLLGCALGVLAGWGFARMTSVETTDYWAGGVIGGATGAALCALIAATFANHRRHRAAATTLRD